MENKKLILAIDDNMSQHVLFQGMLSPQYILRAAKSTSEALSFLNKNKVDLILLDIEMPNISGFEFLEDIRKIPSYMEVPIIIVSGKTGEDFLKQAKNSSAFDVLTKPVDAKHLIATIEKAFA
ncbi:MAG: response regulator [Treponema sp.]|nr:response regulator [Treponema sp.]